MTHENTTLPYTSEGQILLTYELLFLLQWLIEHESDALKKIIARSLKNGFNDPELRSQEVIEMHITDPNIHQCIVDFLSHIDALLIEATAELDIKKNTEHMLIPALKHIDSSICDTEIVEGSLKKTHSRIHQSSDNAQEILLKELLRRWKPDKKVLTN